MKASTAMMLSAMMSTGTPRPYGEPRGEAMRPGRLHDTKPYENTADARERKKAERQRKKAARRANRR